MSIYIITKLTGLQCQVWLVNVPTIEKRSRHAWPADVGWAYARRVKGCGDGSVREYTGVEVRERFLVVEECEGRR